MSKKSKEQKRSSDRLSVTASQGRSQTGLRLHNERRILSLIRQHGALPKAKIAELTGLSAQAVTVIINDLAGEELLLKGEPHRGRVGQPSVPYSLNPDGALAYGLKVGRRSFDLTLEDFVGDVRGALHLPCPYPTVDNMLSFLRRGLESLESGIGHDLAGRIRGIGVATPFELWSWAEELSVPTEVLEQWRDFSFEEELAAITDYPVHVCNDDTAACVAEVVFGNPGNYRDFLYVFIGSFIGGGVVLNDTPIMGSRGNAGAVGSMPVPYTGNSDTMPSQQLIMSASVTTLERMLVAAGQDSAVLWKSSDSWGNLGETLDEWIEMVASGVAYAAVSSAALMDLEAIVVDGSIPHSVRQQIVQRVEEKAHAMDLRGMSSFQIVEGTIGSKAQSIGSASLPLLANFFNVAPD